MLKKSGVRLIISIVTLFAITGCGGGGKNTPINIGNGNNQINGGGGSSNNEVNPPPISPPPISPPPISPSISIYYPWENGRVNVVGEGVILTIKGRVSYDGGLVSSVEAVVDGEVVARTVPSPDGYFELDVTRFGNIKGNKQLEIIATTTDNIKGTYKLNIIYDDSLLYNLAIGFLRKYSTDYTGQLFRLGNLNNGPYTKPVKVWVEKLPYQYHELVKRACDFWNKYTGIQFDIVSQQIDPNQSGIVVLPQFDKDPGHAAAVQISFEDPSIGEISWGIICLYKEWITYNDNEKWISIAHEIGHVLVVHKGHTDEGDIMDYMGPTRDLFHTYQQLAMKIKYNKNPGEQL